MESLQVYRSCHGYLGSLNPITKIFRLSLWTHPLPLCAFVFNGLPLWPPLSPTLGWLELLCLSLHTFRGAAMSRSLTQTSPSQPYSLNKTDRWENMKAQLSYLKLAETLRHNLCSELPCGIRLRQAIPLLLGFFFHAVDTVVLPTPALGLIHQLLGGGGGVLPTVSPVLMASWDLPWLKSCLHLKPCPNSGQPSPNDWLMMNYKDPNAFPQLFMMLMGPFTFGAPPAGSWGLQRLPSVHFFSSPILQKSLPSQVMTLSAFSPEYPTPGRSRPI